ncbi:hypothetical protein ACV07N_13260 [Roseivirga echinicomitans]
MISIRLRYFFVLALITLTVSCSSNRRATNETPKVEAQTESDSPKLNVVNLYIENSASIYGYTSTNSAYINVVNDLAQFSNIINDTESKFNYFLISGTLNNLEEYFLGSNPSVLTKTLKPEGLRRSTSGNSDINGMFNHVLKSIDPESISILISDGVYDIGEESNPLSALETQGIGTRTTFIKNLKDQDTETVVIKLASQFDGYYYHGAKKASENINHERPYYIWLFGKKELIDTFFSDDRIKGLKGYQNHTVFNRLNGSDIKYDAFSFGNENVRKERDAKTYEISRDREKVVFAIAADLESIRKGSSYLLNPQNYTATLGYSVKKVEEVNSYLNTDGKMERALRNLSSWAPTHLILVESEKPITGQVEITLNSKLPPWITESTSDNDYPLNGNTYQTFGLGTLMNGINEAYIETSGAKDIFNFKITIQQ